MGEPPNPLPKLIIISVEVTPSPTVAANPVTVGVSANVGEEVYPVPAFTTVTVLTPSVERIVAVLIPTLGVLTVSKGGLVYPIPVVILNCDDIPRLFTIAVAVLIPT